MSKIKTRETVKDIKVIDKAAVASQSMKKAFVCSREKASDLLDDRQRNEDEYVADMGQHAAEDVSNDIAHGTVAGTEYTVRKGRGLLQKGRAKKKAVRLVGGEIPMPGPIQQEPEADTPPPRQPHRAAFAPGRISRTKKPPAETIRQAAKSKRKAVKSAQGVKTARRTVKTAQQTSRTAIKTAQTTARTTQQAAQTTVKTTKAATQTIRAAAKAATTTAKAAVKAIKAAVKGILAAGKALVAALAAGGWAALVIVLVICLVGMIAGSCYGILFAGEDTGAELTIQSVMEEIDAEYQHRIDEIIAAVPHDSVEIIGAPAPWEEVLAIYAVRTTTDPDDPLEVVTMDRRKAGLLREVYWIMTEVAYAVEAQTKAPESETGESVQVAILLIHITHRPPMEAAEVFGFSVEQFKQLETLLSEISIGWR